MQSLESLPPYYIIIIAEPYCWEQGEQDDSLGAEMRYSAHANETMVDNIYLRIYNEQPTFPLREPQRFTKALLDFIGTKAQVILVLKIMITFDMCAYACTFPSQPRVYSRNAFHFAMRYVICCQIFTRIVCACPCLNQLHTQNDHHFFTTTLLCET